MIKFEEKKHENNWTQKKLSIKIAASVPHNNKFNKEQEKSQSSFSQGQVIILTNINTNPYIKIRARLIHRYTRIFILHYSGIVSHKAVKKKQT